MLACRSCMDRAIAAAGACFTMSADVSSVMKCSDEGPSMGLAAGGRGWGLARGCAPRVLASSLLSCTGGSPEKPGCSGSIVSCLHASARCPSSRLQRPSQGTTTALRSAVMRSARSARSVGSCHISVLTSLASEGLYDGMGSHTAVYDRFRSSSCGQACSRCVKECPANRRMQPPRRARSPRGRDKFSHAAAARSRKPQRQRKRLLS